MPGLGGIGSFADEMARARRDREFTDVRARARRALPIVGHTTDDHDAIARATRESMQAVKFVPARLPPSHPLKLWRR